MSSIWFENVNLPSFNALQQDITTDVLIIGGGIAGILIANELNSCGVECTLVEQNEILSGVTKNTTAKITLQHGLIYDKIIKTYGVEKAEMYLMANFKALEKYRELAKNVDCDFEEKSSFVYTLNNREKIETEIKALERCGCKARFYEKTNLPFKISCAVEVAHQAQFNPIKFLSPIAEKLKIFERTKVVEIVGTTAICKKFKIKAQKIIVATHFPFMNKYGAFFLKMYQARSYVGVYKDAQNVNGMYIDENSSGFSFRNYKNLLLIGGASKRTGTDTKAWAGVERFANHYYPNSSKIAEFSTQDCITLDSIAYIGQYSKKLPNIFVATGFNKWGMTSSMVAAMILRDKIIGKNNDFEAVFSPQRTIIHPQLFANAFESTKNILTPCKKRCPHLGCALKWNSAERSWDCACHGSRFDENGRVINNPATEDLK